MEGESYLVDSTLPVIQIFLMSPLPHHCHKSLCNSAIIHYGLQKDHARMCVTLLALIWLQVFIVELGKCVWEEIKDDI